MSQTQSQPVQATRMTNGDDETGITKSSTMDIATTRAAQEIMGAMTVAKKFPRDETAARTRIINACKRKLLAEQSQYTFPRGGATVNGPSVRLAECLQQNWGNMEAGVVELERRDGESVAMSYAIDYETNSRDVKIFTVRHIRDTKKGPIHLRDERDIYELVANTGARRKRACILAIIPADVVEEALEQCDKTMAGNTTEPLIDRIRKMVVAFTDFSVTQAMIEKRLGHKIDVTTEAELVSLRKIYMSIRDNMQPRESFFDLGTMGQTKGAADLANELKGKQKTETKQTVAPKQDAPQDAQDTHQDDPETQTTQETPKGDADTQEQPQEQDDGSQQEADPFALAWAQGRDHVKKAICAMAKQNYPSMGAKTAPTGIATYIKAHGDTEETWGTLWGLAADNQFSFSLGCSKADIKND